MPSRSRDPQDQHEFFDTLDSTNRQTPDPRRSAPFQKHFSRPRLEPLSQTENFRRRSTTGRLPAIPQTEGFRRRSTTLRLPAITPSEDFHTRETPPRLPALGQPGPAEGVHLQQAPSGADLWFIPGSRGPGNPDAARSFKLRARLVLLMLPLFVLLGAQSLLVHVASDCVGARMRQSQENCLARSLRFPTLANSVAISPTSKPAKPAAPPGLPAIPNDLPANVHNFVVIALPYAVQAHEELGWHTSVFLAQWGLEHGWHVPDAQGYNWGNTTYAPGCPYHGSRFCYANTPSEGLRQYVYTAHLHYYDGVRAASSRGPDATALALGKSPWDAGHYGGAEDPGSALLKIMKNFNLYRLD